MALTKVTYAMIEGDPINVLDYGAIGDGLTDDTTAIQNAINAGKNIYFPTGTYLCNSTVTVSQNNSLLTFAGGASLTYTTATMTLLTISGNDCQVVNASITAPAVFDGANVQPTYGIIRVTGEKTIIDQVRIINVPKVGVWFDNTNNGTVTNCFINGGTSDTFFTGSNTGHFGICIDPGSTGSQGNFVIANNNIRQCVQGGFSGNYGAASYEQSFAVTGNVFELCWNHGWYSAGVANGVAVTGNAFNACQVPVALTGQNHVVSGNTLVVQTTGSGAATDNEITGIQIRDAVGCVIANNSIKGEGQSGGTVIDLSDNALVSGANRIENNVISGNIIEITNTTVAGVVAIRLVATSTFASNNIISNNVITAPIRINNGLISIIGSNSATSENNVIQGNTVRITGATGNGHGIYLKIDERFN